jgi:hypothetical protein
VLDAAGNFVASTGRVYYVAPGPVRGGANMFDTSGAIAEAATCGTHDFLDCGPPPAAGRPFRAKDRCAASSNRPRRPRLRQSIRKCFERASGQSF